MEMRSLARLFEIQTTANNEQFADGQTDLRVW
jgi:hypothetical protein